MRDYRHILLAADFSEHGDDVARKAKRLVELCGAKLSVIHVLDDIPMPDTPYGTVIPLQQDSSHELLEAKKIKLKQLGERLGIEHGNRWMIWGSPKTEIVGLAERQQADLIVVGSLGRHGLALLLGSTASGVLHHASCDVLAIRLRDPV